MSSSDNDRNRALAREIRRALMVVLIALSDRYDLPPLIREDVKPDTRTDLQTRLDAKASMIDGARTMNPPSR